MKAKYSNIIIAISGGVIFLGILILAIYLPSPGFRNEVKQEASKSLSEVLGREFSVGAVEFHFPFTILINDVAIASHDSLARGQLISAPRIKLQAHPWYSTTRRRMVIGKVELSDVRVCLVKDSSGTWNFADLFKSDTTKPKGKMNLPPLSVEDISFKNLSVSVETPGNKQLIEDINIQLGLKMGGEKLSATLKKIKAYDKTRNISLTKGFGNFAISGDTIKLKEFELNTENSRVNLSVIFNPKSQEIDLSKLDLNFGMADVPRILELKEQNWSGNVAVLAALKGSLSSPQGSLSIRSRELKINDLELSGLDIKIQVKDNLINLTKLYLNAGKGNIEGEGQVDLKSRIYDFNLLLNESDFGAAFAKGDIPLKTEINGDLRIKGREFDPQRARATVDLMLNKSLINSIPVDRLLCNLMYADKSVSIEKFDLTSGQAKLKVKGDIFKEVLSVDVETDEIELAQFGPLLGLKDLQGKLRFTGLVSGLTKDPDVIGSFRLKEAIISNFSCLYFDGSMSLKQVVSKPQGDGKFVATGLAIGSQSIDRVELLTELRGLDWGGLSVHVVKDSMTEALATGMVELKGKQINLAISKLFYSFGDQTVVNSQPIHLSIEGSNINLEPTKLVAGRGAITLEGFYHSDKSVFFKINGDAIDSRRIVDLLNLKKTVHGLLDFDINISGSLNAPEMAASLILNNARFEQFTADRVAIDCRYSDQVVNLDKLAITRYGQLSEIALSVPINLGIGPEAGKLLDQPMSGEVVLRDIGTWAFFPMAELLSVYEGKVDLSVRLSGTPFKPLLNGEMTIANAKMVLRPFGMYLHKVQAFAHFNADSLVIDNITASTENQGKVEIKRGEIILNKFIPSTMYFLIEVEKAPVRNIPFIEGNVNARIEIGGTVNYPRIKGEVYANSALITLPFAPAEEPPPPEGGAKPMDLDLSITGSQGIWLRNADADIELKIENLNVRMRQNVLFLSGRLETIQGVYRFLDRRFDITEGQLTFTNAVVINPELNLAAQTELNDEARTKVFLKVGGSALQPKLAFSSEPSMPEQDILTMLSVGMKIEGDGNGDLGDQVLNRTTDVLSNMLGGMIQKKTGLVDVIKMKTSTGQEKGAEVTLGKYVTKNVFVSYTRGFAANLSEDFRAEYLFGKRSALFVQRSKDEDNKEQKINLGLRMKFKY
ncbi:MAG: translocation/assembly module TamB domain-containing protein [Candidatus Edwardsbacteria bacterium]|nr:translocation/assembly module TamB domain-containing protein [Candidatus Edwardsbacteria bacterium]MBU1577745.1 translocation/assembly module TamB domain-containing protein [Candidatus Edwardsbacteria bacterium]MBU2463877.1 translocation/assembly module TamB domain-containing protein [Candidatus Edwardsbacteria bacterium]MBU2594700.1 translocation/assembly module TamB domain-containing protein [Candidatus Edwardsbacteria bacterium]